MRVQALSEEGYFLIHIREGGVAGVVDVAVALPLSHVAHLQVVRLYRLLGARLESRNFGD
jgi:hypothetical protein